MFVSSVIGKVLESILQYTIYSYLKEKGLIREIQHGFAHNRLWLTNLIEFFEVIKVIDQDRVVDDVYTYFNKMQYLIKRDMGNVHGDKIWSWHNVWHRPCFFVLYVLKSRSEKLENFHILSPLFICRGCGCYFQD